MASFKPHSLLGKCDRADPRTAVATSLVVGVSTDPALAGAGFDAARCYHRISRVRIPGEECSP